MENFIVLTLASEDLTLWQVNGFQKKELCVGGFATLVFKDETIYYYSESNGVLDWCKGSPVPPAKLWIDKAENKSGFKKFMIVLFQQFFGPSMVGHFEYRNGDVFEGKIRCGKPVGTGTMVYADNTTKTGKWFYGKYSILLTIISTIINFLKSNLTKKRK